MHSYVNHSKTAKKNKKNRYSTISSDFPKQSQLECFSTKQQTRSNQTNHWVALGEDQPGMEVEALRGKKK